MRPRFLRLDAVIHGDRHAAISSAIGAIGKSGGWIVSHTLLSDSLAIVNFILPANAATQLADALSQATIRAKAEAEIPNGTAEQELNCQLTLIFVNGSGNLRHDVPAVG